MRREIAEKKRRKDVLDRFLGDFSRPWRNDWGQRIFKQVVTVLIDHFYISSEDLTQMWLSI